MRLRPTPIRRDQMFRELLTYMMENSSVVFSAFELVLVAKNLERIGDHATNIAEDVIYFVAGRDVRHPALDSNSRVLPGRHDERSSHHSFPCAELYLRFADLPALPRCCPQTS